MKALTAKLVAMVVSCIKFRDGYEEL